LRRYPRLFLSAAIAAAALAQTPRPSDWLSAGGNAQRTGWEENDSDFSKTSVKGFKAVLQRKFDSPQAHLMAPLIIGRLISYKGFKELAIVVSSSGHVRAVDVDLNQVFWERELPAPASTCAPDITAMPAMMPAPDLPPGTPGRNAPRPIYLLSSDGKLYRLNPSTGEDVAPPVSFIPAGAAASNLAVVDNVAYTTTAAGCGATDAVWALDLHDSAPKVASYPLKGRATGPAVGYDGTIFVQTADAGLLALSPKDLKLKQSFAVAGGSVTPVVFPWRGRDLIAGADGSRLYLADSRITRTEPGDTAFVALSTWEDGAHVRWIVAAASKYYAAFRVEDQSGQPVLTKVWQSSSLIAPQKPAIANGVVFGLEAGDATHHARLHAFDAATGAELFSSGDQIPSAANPTGLSFANGRAYFTVDNTLFAFGQPMEQ
jgi:outer membrane protein assembly factor BamB